MGSASRLAGKESGELLAICKETIVFYICEKSLDESFTILLRDEDG
jgi:hypothetical protein